MKYFRFSLVLAVSLIMFGILDPAPAQSAVLDCHSPKVLSKVVRRFNQADKTYWKRGYRLSFIDGTHSHGMGSNYESTFYREYCHGTAHFDDDSYRKIHFLIEEVAGFAGFGWNVEYCVHGLDPWYYHDGKCRVLDPKKRFRN